MAVNTENPFALLYIEPNPKHRHPAIDDDLVSFINALLVANKSTISGLWYYGDKNSKLEDFVSGDGWKGLHYVDDFMTSSNRDYKLEAGFVTNSCAAYYLKHYRNQIPQSEIEKLKKLCEYHGQPWGRGWFMDNLNTYETIEEESELTDIDSQLDMLGDLEADFI